MMTSVGCCSKDKQIHEVDLFQSTVVGNTKLRHDLVELCGLDSKSCSGLCEVTQICLDLIQSCLV